MYGYRRLLSDNYLLNYSVFLVLVFPVYAVLIQYFEVLGSGRDPVNPFGSNLALFILFFLGAVILRPLSKILYWVLAIYCSRWIVLFIIGHYSLAPFSLDVEANKQFLAGFINFTPMLVVGLVAGLIPFHKLLRILADRCGLLIGEQLNYSRVATRGLIALGMLIPFVLTLLRLAPSGFPFVGSHTASLSGWSILGYFLIAAVASLFTAYFQLPFPPENCLGHSLQEYVIFIISGWDTAIVLLVLIGIVLALRPYIRLLALVSGVYVFTGSSLFFLWPDWCSQIPGLPIIVSAMMWVLIVSIVLMLTSRAARITIPAKF